ncbi:MAG: DNA repair protein RecO [Candidatus Daviesbacteria bacterium]|nr:DNA repair protein RecO [Candidatus Daviesbacteria bacterium]
MPGFKTEGIVLKRRDFGEADRILTVFSKDKGKITVIAKGVRRITSRRAGNVELLNRVSMYLHQARSLPILTEATSLDTFQKIKEDLTLSTYAYHIIELIDKFTAENQENRIIYGDLVQVLERLSKKPRQILIRAFEAKILNNLGFVDFDKKILQDLASFNWDQIEQIKIEEKEALDLERGLRYTIEKILEGELKSRKFLKKV